MEIRAEVAVKEWMQGEQRALEAGIEGEEKKKCNMWGIFTVPNLYDIGIVQGEQRSGGFWRALVEGIAGSGDLLGLSGVGIVGIWGDRYLPVTMQVQLTVGQHRFELLGSAHMWNFFY